MYAGTSLRHMCSYSINISSSADKCVICLCRGGLIKWADLTGVKHVAARLEGWAKQYEGAGLAGFFKPCEYLATAAKEGRALGAGASPQANL